MKEFNFTTGKETNRLKIKAESEEKAKEILDRIIIESNIPKADWVLIN